MYLFPAPVQGKVLNFWGFGEGFLGAQSAPNNPSPKPQNLNLDNFKNHVCLKGEPTNAASH